MLVLSRKEDQTIVFPNLGISIEIVRVQGNKVCVGVEAPKAIRVVRGELQSNTDAESKDGSSEFPLGRFIELLAPEARRELRNRLSDASLSVHAAQNQFEQGGLNNVEFFLNKAVEALAHLNKMFESQLPDDSTNCVQEARLTYGLASGGEHTPQTSLSDRGMANWFTKAVTPHQLVEYLQAQLCSSN